MLHFLLSIALCLFILLGLFGRRVAQIALISGVAVMILLFANNMLQSELRSRAIRQEATAAIVPPQCPPAKPSVKMTDDPTTWFPVGKSILDAYNTCAP